MKINHLLAGTTLASMLLFTGTEAGATPLINLGGYTGDIQIKFQNFENFTGTGTLSPSNSNYGVISITSIVGGPSFNTTLWTPGGSNGFLSGVFYGVHVDSVSGTGSIQTGSASGGHIVLFSDATNFDATQGTSGYTSIGCLVNTGCYNGITNVGGDEVLNLDLASGIDPTNSNTTLSATFTLGTFPFTGSSNSYLDIASGTAAGQFGRADFPTAFGPRDMFVEENFCVAGSATACEQVGNWSFDSHDPVFATVVPEPTSLALIGSALFGFGVVGIRRRKRG